MALFSSSVSDTHRTRSNPQQLLWQRRHLLGLLCHFRSEWIGARDSVFCNPHECALGLRLRCFAPREGYVETTGTNLHGIYGADEPVHHVAAQSVSETTPSGLHGQEFHPVNRCNLLNMMQI